MSKLVNKIERELRNKGYSIQENVFSKKACDHLGKILDQIEKNKKFKKFVTNEGAKQTSLKTKNKKIRQAQILNVHCIYPEIFLKYISNKLVLGVLKKNFKENFILSNFNASRAVKSNEKKYRIHMDSRLPISDFSNTTHIVALICIDDFTKTNGALVVVENSHKSNANPRNKKINHSQLKTAIAPKGSIIFTTGQTWHDIGHNLDGKRRWGIIAYYSRWWIKPTFDFVSNCSKKTFSMCNNIQKELLGFNSTPPSKWSIKRHKTLRPKTKIPKKYSDLNNYLYN